MELLFAICVFAPAFALAANKGSNPKSYTNAWAYLFATAAAFRLLIAISPTYAPLLVRVLVLVLTFASLKLLKKPKFAIEQIPLAICATLLALHGYFPAFDVDSLAYHMPSVTWLMEWPHLPAFQQRPENITIWYLWLGFEEFLTIPGLGLDLALFTGLVGTGLKLLTLFTLVNLLPKKASDLRALAAFLLLIDDHFFFSGQNRFVFMNPGFIGLIGLLGWHTCRALRGYSASFYAVLALAIALPAVKYHGLYFSLGAGILCVIGFGLKRKIPARPQRREQLFLFAALALVLAALGPHFVYGGSPLLPFNLGPFHAHLPNRGMEVLEDYGSQVTMLAAASAPLRRMIFPGNLALKITVVLMWFAIPLWLLRKRLRISKRWLEIASLGFASSFVWPIIAQHLRDSESRYPRYVFAFTALAICALPLAMRKLNPLSKTITNAAQLLGGFALALWLVFTIDTRNFNVPAGYRPNWGSIRSFLSYRGRTSTDITAAHMWGLLMPNVEKNITPLFECIRKVSSASGSNIERGDHLVMFTPFTSFPSHIISPMAAQGSYFDGGGYIKLPRSSTSLKDYEIEYAVIPREPYPAFAKFGAMDAYKNWIPLKFDEREICGSPDLRLVRVL